MAVKGRNKRCRQEPAALGFVREGDPPLTRRELRLGEPSLTRRERRPGDSSLTRRELWLRFAFGERGEELLTG